MTAGGETKLPSELRCAKEAEKHWQDPDDGAPGLPVLHEDTNTRVQLWLSHFAHIQMRERVLPSQRKPEQLALALHTHEFGGRKGFREVFGEGFGEGGASGS